MAAFLWWEVRKSKVSEGKGKEAFSFQRSVDLWGWLGRAFFLAI